MRGFRMLRVPAINILRLLSNSLEGFLRSEECCLNQHSAPIGQHLKYNLSYGKSKVSGYCLKRLSQVAITFNVSDCSPLICQCRSRNGQIVRQMRISLSLPGDFYPLRKIAILR